MPQRGKDNEAARGDVLRYALEDSIERQIENGELPAHARRQAREQDEVDKDAIAKAVALGVKEGFALAIKDTELMASFWKNGYMHLTEHASTKTQLWVGRRIMAVIIVFLFGWCLKWLFEHGAFTK